MEDSVDRNLEGFQTFLTYCKKVLIEDSKPVALMKLIKKRYNECDEDFTESDKFYDLLTTYHAKMLNDRTNFSVYLKQFLDVLKKRKSTSLSDGNLRTLDGDKDNTSGSDNDPPVKKQSKINGEVERSTGSDLDENDSKNKETSSSKCDETRQNVTSLRDEKHNSSDKENEVENEKTSSSDSDDNVERPSVLDEKDDNSDKDDDIEIRSVVNEKSSLGDSDDDVEKRSVGHEKSNSSDSDDNVERPSVGHEKEASSDKENELERQSVTNEKGDTSDSESDNALDNDIERTSVLAEDKVEKCTSYKNSDIEKNTELDDIGEDRSRPSSDEENDEEKPKVSDEISIVEISHTSERESEDDQNSEINHEVKTSQNKHENADENSGPSYLDATVEGQSIAKDINTTIEIESLSEDDSNCSTKQIARQVFSDKEEHHSSSAVERLDISWLDKFFESNPKISIPDKICKKHESDSKWKHGAGSSSHSGKRKHDSTSSSEDERYRKKVVSKKEKKQKRYKTTVGKSSIKKNNDVYGVNSKGKRKRDTSSSSEDEDYQKKSVQKKDKNHKRYKITTGKSSLNTDHDLHTKTNQSPKKLSPRNKSPKRSPGKSPKQTPTKKSPIIIVTDSESSDDIGNSKYNHRFDVQKKKQFGIESEPMIKLVKVKMEFGVQEEESRIAEDKPCSDKGKPHVMEDKSPILKDDCLNNQHDDQSNSPIKDPNDDDNSGHESEGTSNKKENYGDSVVGNETDLKDDTATEDLISDRAENDTVTQSKEKQTIKRIPLVTEVLYDKSDTKSTNRSNQSDESQEQSDDNDKDNKLKHDSDAEVKSRTDPNTKLTPTIVNDSRGKSSSRDDTPDMKEISKVDKSEKAAAKTPRTDDEAEPSTSTSDGAKKGSSKQIIRLEKLLEQIRDKIEEVRAKELDLDDLNSNVSDYLLEDKLQQKFLKVWDKLCVLHNSATSTGRATEKYFRYQGTRYKDVNRKIEKFINKRKVFPDYHDIKGIIIKVNKDKKLHLSPKLINDLAQEAFLEVGNKLQSRRKKDFASNLGSHKPWHSREQGDDSKLFSVYNDPALYDTELKRKLDANKKLAKTGIEQVVDRYARLQYEVREENEEDEDDEEEEEEEEEILKGNQVSKDLDTDVARLLEQDEGLESEGNNDLEFVAPITREKKEKIPPKPDKPKTSAGFLDHFMELVGLQKTTTNPVKDEKETGKETTKETPKKEVSEIHVISIDSDEEELESGKAEKDKSSYAKTDNFHKDKSSSSKDNHHKDNHKNVNKDHYQKGITYHTKAYRDPNNITNKFPSKPYDKNPHKSTRLLDTSNSFKTVNDQRNSGSKSNPANHPHSKHKKGASHPPEDLIVIDIDDDEVEYHEHDNYNQYHESYEQYHENYEQYHEGYNQYHEGYDNYPDENNAHYPDNANYDQYYEGDNYSQYPEDGAYDQYPDQYYDDGNYDQYENADYQQYPEDERFSQYPTSTADGAEVVILDDDDTPETSEVNNAPLNFRISSPRHISEHDHLQVKNNSGKSKSRLDNSIGNSLKRGNANLKQSHSIKSNSQITCIEIDDDSLTSPPDGERINRTDGDSLTVEDENEKDLSETANDGLTVKEDEEHLDKTSFEEDADRTLHDEINIEETEDQQIRKSTPVKPDGNSSNKGDDNDELEGEIIPRESDIEDEAGASDSEIEEGETSPNNSDSEDEDISDDCSSNPDSINDKTISPVHLPDVDDGNSQASENRFVAIPLNLYEGQEVIECDEDEEVEDYENVDDEAVEADDVQYNEQHDTEANELEISEHCSLQQECDEENTNKDLNDEDDDVNVVNSELVRTSHQDKLDTKCVTVNSGFDSTIADSDSEPEGKTISDSLDACISIVKLDDLSMNDNENNQYESIPDIFDDVPEDDCEDAGKDKTLQVSNQSDNEDDYEETEVKVNVNDEDNGESVKESDKGFGFGSDNDTETNDEDIIAKCEDDSDSNTEDDGIEDIDARSDEDKESNDLGSDNDVETINEGKVEDMGAYDEFADANNEESVHDIESINQCTGADSTAIIEKCNRNVEEDNGFDSGSQCSESLLSTSPVSKSLNQDISDEAETNLPPDQTVVSIPDSDSHIPKSDYCTERLEIDKSIDEREFKSHQSVIGDESSSVTNDSVSLKTRNRDEEEETVDETDLEGKQEHLDSNHQSCNESEMSDNESNISDQHDEETNIHKTDACTYDNVNLKSTEIENKTTDSSDSFDEGNLNSTEIENKTTETSDRSSFDEQSLKPTGIENLTTKTSDRDDYDEKVNSNCSEINGKVDCVAKLKHPNVKNKIIELGKVLNTKILSGKKSEPVTKESQCVGSRFMLNEEEEHLDLIERYQEPDSYLSSNVSVSPTDVIELSDSE